MLLDRGFIKPSSLGASPLCRIDERRERGRERGRERVREGGEKE